MSATRRTAVSPTRRWRRPGIGLRLLAAQAIVLAVGAATTAVVAAVVGPPLFREHLHRAGVPTNSPEEMHAEEAYGYATVMSIGGAHADGCSVTSPTRSARPSRCSTRTSRRSRTGCVP